MEIKKPWMVIKPVQFHQNPIPKPSKSSKATEPEPNPYLYRKEDDEVGGAVGEEPQEFEAWNVRERGR